MYIRWENLVGGVTNRLPGKKSIQLGPCWLIPQIRLHYLVFIPLKRGISMVRCGLLLLLLSSIAWDSKQLLTEQLVRWWFLLEQQGVVELLSFFTPDKNKVLQVWDHQRSSIPQQKIKYLEMWRSDSSPNFYWRVLKVVLALTCPLGNASTVSISSVKIARPSSGLCSSTHRENSRINSMCWGPKFWGEGGHYRPVQFALISIPVRKWLS